MAELQHDRIGELLSQMDDDAGTVPEEMLAEARETWRRLGEGNASIRIMPL